ncbi:hypothetical protein HHK36_017662 [Tetracentron sinense]|uniref:Cation efflux protein transmembrane domain-containing protein n=1 Tax=Tetracentron sinense TaxID=13715 RepID=A0A834YX83_TETSI|nr:hypothetical protein HHK36_017662 [Tetracentron sinense]
MEDSRVSRDSLGAESDSRFHSLKSTSFNYRTSEGESQQSWNGEFGFGVSDRRFAFSRQASFHQSAEPHTPISIISNDSIRPLLSRTVSSIDIPPAVNPQIENENIWKDYMKPSFGEGKGSSQKFSFLLLVLSVFGVIRSGNRPMKRLFVLISLNMAYSTAELFIGLLTGRVGLVSDAFHLTFGCGLLTFSLFAMAASQKKPDGVYTYGYKRLQVLSAFTNAVNSASTIVTTSKFVDLGNLDALCSFVHEDFELVRDSSAFSPSLTMSPLGAVTEIGSSQGLRSTFVGESFVALSETQSLQDLDMIDETLPLAPFLPGR